MDALSERLQGGASEGGAPTLQHRVCLARDSWGAGLPSFWCSELPTSTASSRQYLVREDSAAHFNTQFPDYVGGNIQSVGRTVEKATLDAQLVTCEPPTGAIRNSQARRPQRFVNERLRLTEAGESELARGCRRNLIVWGFRYRCAGSDTYICESVTAISVSPDGGAPVIPRVLQAGATVVAEETKTVGGKRWIRVGPGWACYVDTQSGAVKLRAAGCKRQCGGLCVCAAGCTGQVKKRHGCDLVIKYERTLARDLHFV
jgi:hypothetical protein